MWGRIEYYFDEYFVRKFIVKIFLKYGFRVFDDMKIKVGDIEVLYIKIVKVFDVDRRVVKEIVGMIFKVFELRDIYMNFELIVYMKYVGRYVGYGVIEIEFELRVVGIFVKIV